jgi:hypothetical protein
LINEKKASSNAALGVDISMEFASNLDDPKGK